MPLWPWDLRSWYRSELAYFWSDQRTASPHLWNIWEVALHNHQSGDLLFFWWRRGQVQKFWIGTFGPSRQCKKPCWASYSASMHRRGVVPKVLEELHLVYVGLDSCQVIVPTALVYGNPEWDRHSSPCHARSLTTLARHLDMHDQLPSLRAGRVQRFFLLRGPLSEEELVRRSRHIQRTIPRMFLHSPSKVTRRFFEGFSCGQLKDVCLSTPSTPHCWR